MRHRSAPRQPRPVSIAVTGITHDAKSETKKSDTKPPLPKARKSSVGSRQNKLKKKPVSSPTEGSPKPLTSPVIDSEVIFTQSDNENVNNNLIIAAPVQSNETLGVKTETQHEEKIQSVGTE